MEKAVMEVARKRGRPPKISHEELIEKAMELMATTPDKPLSLNALAKAVGVTPMAIYRYVDDRDTLLQQVASRLLADLKPVIPDQPWPDQVRFWANATRAFFLKHPALFTILGWQHHIASAWLEQLATLTRILQQTELKGARLADAVQWVSMTVMGAIYMEIASKQSGYQVTPEDIRELQAEDAELVETLMHHLWKKNARAVFTDSVERVIFLLEKSRP